MELEKALEEKGVKSLDELEEKARNEALAKAKADNQTSIDALKVQITDLEKIKGEQSVEVGEIRKQLQTAEAEKTALAEKISQEKANDDLKKQEKESEIHKQNQEREKVLTDADWKVLEAAIEGASDEVRELATSSEEGRAAFMDEVLGKQTPTNTGRETFRRPAQEEKLTIQEQIARGIGTANRFQRPNGRLAGTGFDSNRQPASAPDKPPSFSGSLSDRIRQSKK